MERKGFDTVTGLTLDAALRSAIEARFAESTPASCPSDPLEKQQHLRALAFAALVRGESRRAAGRADFVAVIDVGTRGHRGTADGDDRSRVVRVTRPIPLEVPASVLTAMLGAESFDAVVVCDGVVLHAPGRLDLGRSTRLANRAPRRALRGLYPTCAIPGCAVHYDRCKLHHVVWWREGGRTDLDNLLPVCAHHHAKIHDAGWRVSLGRRRALTVTFPDGHVRSTGPPSRPAA